MQLLQSTFSGLSLAEASTARRQSVKRNVAQKRCNKMIVKASMVAEPAKLDVKKIDGGSSGTAELALRVAEPETSKGLVHRYLVMIRQNMRQVCRCCCW